jgi:hypothetical protein
MIDRRALSHDEALELAGLFVLGALDEAEERAVREHLDGCAMDHAELAELSRAAQTLALAVEPLDAPPEARARVLDAIAREAAQPLPAAQPLVAAAEPATPAAPPLARREVLAPPPGRPDRRTGERRSPLAGLFGSGKPAWVALAAAVAVIAGLGAWSVQLNERATYLERRADTIARAMAASVVPGAEVAVLRGSGPASGAAGIAVLDTAAHSHIVIVGLPPAPAGHTYQAWHIAGGVPQSAGLLTVDEDGYAVLADVPAEPGVEVVALTLEVAGGVDAPTAEPIVVGALRDAGPPPPGG